MKRILLITITSLFSVFTVFGQEILSLEDFRQAAISANKEIQISKERVKIAGDLKKAAFTQFLPRISANASYQWNQKNISLLAEDAFLPVGSIAADGSLTFTQDQLNNSWTTVNGTAVPLDSDGNPFDPSTNPEKLQIKNYAYLPKESMEYDINNVMIGTISLVQPIFMGMKVKELYNISKANENIAKSTDENKLQQLIIKVDEAYWRVVSIYNKKELANKYCELLEKLMYNVNEMYKAGVATKVDVLNVRVEYNEATMQKINAENGYSLCKMALFQLCGMDLNSNIEPADKDINNMLIKEDKVIDIDQAINSRSEIKILNQTKKIADYNVGIAKSRFMPNIFANVNYVVSNPNAYNGFNKSFNGMFNAGVTVNIPILHWGDEIHTLNAAKRARNIMDLRVEQTKDLIKLQINQSKFKLEEASKKYNQSIENQETAQENLKFAQDAFDEGLVSVSDLMKAQTAWIKANSERIDSSINYRMCNLYLKKAQGKEIYHSAK